MRSIMLSDGPWELENTNYDRKAALFYKVFDFSNIGAYHTLEDLLMNEKSVFQNTIRIDGVGMDFIFARNKKPEHLSVKLELTDFGTEELNRDYQLCGVDPGITDIFVAAYGCGSESHEFRSFSNAEFYAKAGYNQTQEIIRRMKRDDERILRIERNLPTGKTG
ncbi:hypothetical protein DFQ29_003649, partial [Apophysomyces sp. BC1021]